MATTTTGTPITPARMGMAKGLAIVESTTQAHQQAAFALAAMCVGKADAVPSLALYAVRLRAVDAPLWGKAVGAADVRFMRTHPSAKWGTMHVFVSHGGTIACVGGHAGATDSCDAKSKTVGFRVDGPLALPDALRTSEATVKAAQRNFDAMLARLRAAKCNDADLLATPSIAQLVEAGLRVGTRSTAPKAKREKAATPALVPAGNVPAESDNE